MKRPNLFSFATSELSQDAFICWLLSWADDINKEYRSSAHFAGRRLINEIYSKSKMEMPSSMSVEVVRQYHGIDIMCILNNNTAIIIEDKVHSSEHGDQLERYRRVAADQLKVEKIIPVFIKTGDQCDYSGVEDQRYIAIIREDLLRILETVDNDCESSEVLDCFTEHLKNMDDKVNGFQDKPVDQWDWDSWIGFYKYLIEERGRVDGRYDYVPNPRGGFLGFWWHWHKDENNIKVYLQLEQNKFCFKVEVLDEDKARKKGLRDQWSKDLVTDCSENVLQIKRPQRLGFGKYMTVAIVDHKFPVVSDNGLIDIERSVALIEAAEEILSNHKLFRLSVK